MNVQLVTVSPRTVGSGAAPVQETKKPLGFWWAIVLLSPPKWGVVCSRELPCAPSRAECLSGLCFIALEGGCPPGMKGAAVQGLRLQE
ncbi:hypothetical protein FOZ63_025283, partial [Perkinsus olseni]